MTPATKPSRKPHGPHQAAAPTTPPTSGATEPASSKPEPPAAPTPTIRQRRRPALIALGVTLAALGGLGGAYLAQRGGTPQSVLVTANRLDPGHKITLEDLKPVQIGTVEGATTLPEGARASLVGKTVANRIDAGTILNPSSIVDAIVPGTGSSVVGIGVKPGQYPQLGLKAGDQVHIVVSANSQNTNTASTIKPGSAWAGSIVSVGDANRDGIRTVDVLLPADQARQAATAGGTGALTLVLDSTTGK